MTTRTLTAADQLDHAHPYRRGLESVHVLRRQLVAVAGFMALIAVMSHADRRAVPLEASGLLVELLLAAALAARRAAVHRRARDLIIERGTADLVELQPVAVRLLSEPHRRRLAADLRRALAQAQVYDRLTVASRPPPAIRRLARHDCTVAWIAARLEQPQPPVRGVALVERLFDGGYGASLYHLDGRALEAELTRIRIALSGGSC